uniref:Uncharacterized protein n=1 Tax=Schistosoma mansoni TaxID=6183 RepID=A0A5K4F4N6_SCHMA
MLGVDKKEETLIQLSFSILDDLCLNAKNEDKQIIMSFENKFSKNKFKIQNYFNQSFKKNGLIDFDKKVPNDSTKCYGDYSCEFGEVVFMFIVGEKLFQLEYF